MNRTFLATIDSIVLFGGVLAEILWIMLWPVTATDDTDTVVSQISADLGRADAAVWLDLPVLLLIPAVLVALGTRGR